VPEVGASANAPSSPGGDRLRPPRSGPAGISQPVTLVVEEDLQAMLQWHAPTFACRAPPPGTYTQTQDPLPRPRRPAQHPVVTVLGARCPVVGAGPYGARGVSNPPREAPSRTRMQLSGSCRPGARRWCGYRLASSTSSVVQLCSWIEVSSSRRCLARSSISLRIAATSSCRVMRISERE